MPARNARAGGPAHQQAHARRIEITTVDSATPTTHPHRARPGGRIAAGTAGRLTLTDLAVVALVTAAIRAVSQPLTFLHTPDSEFYFTLGAFGSEVTDRAPHDSYFWTKLGIVAPMRGLTAMLPPLTGLAVFHVALLALVVGAAYAIARLRWARWGAAAAAAFAGLNTVVLGFLGDPYASGAAIAGLFALLATATRWTLGPRPVRVPSAALMGLIAAWLVMINPYALIVGAAGCAGLLLADPRRVLAAGVGRLARCALALVGALVAGFAGFIALGWWLFPGLGWITSIRSFLTGTDLSNWAAKDWTWLASETSLLVPGAAAAVTLVAVALRRRDPQVRAGALLIWVTLVVSVAYKLYSDSNVLEHSVYSSMLWPAALLSLVLVAGAFAEPSGRWAAVTAAVGPVVWVVAGHWTTVITMRAALAATGGALVLVSWLLLRGRTGRPLSVGPRPVVSAGLAALMVLGALFAVLANGRPQDPTHLHRRVLYAQAFQPGQVAAVLAQDWAIQRWVLDTTEADEQLMVWNETETRSAAAMQLWGPNTVGTGFGGALGDEGLATIRTDRPDAIVTYSAGEQAVADVRRELEQEWVVADPTCRTFPGDGIAPIEVCVLRLDGRTADDGARG